MVQPDGRPVDSLFDTFSVLSRCVKRSDGDVVNSVNDQVPLCVVVPMYSSSFVTAVLLGPAP